ncbi:right-handed parallel beta-helix repeat-containing protein [Tahibacter sp. UC22_41]|uniref:right-handed parallel beta-helix repeat-containing protein n=1 Tax=Tahibacter sp. UC22_41 TaxID=3350178 RepID=UPI0036DCDAE3
MRRAALPWVVSALLAPAAATAQNSAGLVAVEGYGNLETAGAVATVSGDVNRNASVTLAWRRSGEAAFRPAQELLRIDATHLVGSLFDLAPDTVYELRFTLADPDGVTSAATATTSFATRADTLVAANLRTLYVAPGGNDANDGLSPARALATVQRAANLAQAGDLVTVAAGVYREQVSLPRSGTATQPIVLQGQPGAVLDGAELLAAGSAWEASQGAYRRADANPSWQILAGTARLFRYDSLAQLQALAAGAPGGYCYDGGYLYLKLSDGSSPATHDIHIARRENGFVADGRSHLRIEGFEIRHYGSTEYGKGVYLRQSSDVIVRANRIHDVGAAGVWIKGGTRHRIEDNGFDDSSIAGWPWDQTKGSSAENNGVVLTDDVGRGHVIRRNRFDGAFNGIGACGGSAPPDGSFTNEIDIYRNRFRHHNDDALEPEGYCANVRIFENTIRDSHMAFAVAPASPGPTWIVRNVAYDIGNTRSSQVDGYTSSLLKINSGYPQVVGPVLLLHNTVQTTAPNTEALYLLNPGTASLIRSRNNLYASTRNVLTKVNAVAVDADYDLLHTTATNRLASWMSTNYTNLAAFQAGAQQEIHGVFAPPGLVAAAAGDFRLRSDSAAIDRGAVLPGINDGYAGAAPDLGAFEHDADRIFANDFGWPKGAPLL